MIHWLTISNNIVVDPLMKSRTDTIPEASLTSTWINMSRIFQFHLADNSCKNNAPIARKLLIIITGADCHDGWSR